MSAARQRTAAFVLVALCITASFASQMDIDPVFEPPKFGGMDLISESVLSDPLLVVPPNEELIKARDSQTAFGTLSSHKSIDSHCDFLYHQAHVVWPTVVKRLEQYGVQDGIHFVDFGGGPGPLAALIAERYPKSTITVVDIDHAFLSYGIRRYADLVRAGRVSFIHASVLNTTLAHESADVVVSQFVFQHLYQPREALAEVHRILKPGGRLLVIDVDENMTDIIYPMPPTSVLGGRMNALHSARHATGLTSGNLFRWLADLLLSYKFADVSVQTDLMFSTVAGNEHFIPLLAPSQYYALVRHGMLTEDTYDEVEQAFKEYVEKTKDTFQMIVLCAYWSGVKMASHLEASAFAATTWIPALVDFENQIAEGLRAQKEKRTVNRYVDAFYMAKLEAEDEAGENVDPLNVTIKDDPMRLEVDAELLRARILMKEHLAAKKPSWVRNPTPAEPTPDSSSSSSASAQAQTQTSSQQYQQVFRPVLPASKARTDVLMKQLNPSPERATATATATATAATVFASESVQSRDLGPPKPPTEGNRAKKDEL